MNIKVNMDFKGPSNSDIQNAIKEELRKHGVSNVDVVVSSSGAIEINGSQSDMDRASEILSGESGMSSGHTIKPHIIKPQMSKINVEQSKIVVRNASERPREDKKPKQ